VLTREKGENRFNGFPRAGKPLKRLAYQNARTTRLKPGVNESNDGITHFRVSQSDIINLFRLH
jgi:hypothetical protein